MSEHAAVLFANEAFYLAFSSRDFEAMEQIWAVDAAVSCLHPGWPPLFDRDDVMESWEAILSNATSPQIVCDKPVAHVFGDTAYVVCHEVLDQGFLLATNIFVRENRNWKLVHHQAGAAPPPSDKDDPEPPRLV